MTQLHRFVSLSCSAIGLIVIATAACAQSEEMVRKTKETYERAHPGERTYLVEELVAAIESADVIMPNAKALTYERNKEIGGPFFGASMSWKTSRLPKRPDGFTDTRRFGAANP
jgi:hypothetical protein